MEKLSRTKKKKAAEELQKLGEQLVALDTAELDSLNLPDELKEAVRETHDFKSHGARRRQLQFIGRLMRTYGGDSVKQALSELAAKEVEKSRRFKQIERWRDELVGGNEDRCRWLIHNFQNLDKRQLNLLMDCARGLNTQIKPKEASRKLFRLLSALPIDGHMEDL